MSIAASVTKPFQVLPPKLQKPAMIVAGVIVALVAFMVVSALVSGAIALTLFVLKWAFRVAIFVAVIYLGKKFFTRKRRSF